ncbi:hypothetical protein Ga0074812_16111 [Parafrankia irregularis]|uniref:Uncharacterized protein n=1 Tax=Parafrankia irregularis TaxID=795642 RepID=A0A0S4R030_9ACTN|nr:hypothetical protein Ga0074812_16111 [Parafrankia irregularis]
MTADREAGTGLGIGPAQFVVDLLAALFDPVSDPVDPDEFSETSGRARAGRRPPPSRAWVAEPTGLLELYGWPPGMRVVLYREPQHSGAQLHVTDVGGNRITVFATNGPRGQFAVLSYATVAGPAARTGSEVPRTAAWRTCPYTTSR